MNGEDSGARQWLDRATAAIRFGPDRAQVRRELADHLEDKTADLMRIFPGMGEEEARDRALAQMGDPEEIGKELGKIHRPWLGRLWMLTNVMMAPVVVAAVAALAFSLVFLPFVSLGDWEIRQAVFGIPNAAQEALSGRELTPWSDRVWVDDCLLTMERAVLVPPEKEGDTWSLVARLRTLSPRVWVQQRAFPRYLSATDSLGNRWMTAMEVGALSKEDRPAARWVDGAQELQEDILLSLPHFLWDDYQVRLGQVDPEAEWVRLEYDRMGRSFSMTVALKGGRR